MEITSSPKKNFASAVTLTVRVALTTFCYFFISCGTSTEGQKWPIAEMTCTPASQATSASEHVEGSVPLPSTAKINSEKGFVL